jgi:type 1 glutamine amidotransferase
MNRTYYPALRRFAALACMFTMSALAAAAHAESAPEASARRILIITGEDYPGHKWQETAPVLQQQLAKDARLKVEVLDDLKKLGSTDLSPYAAVVIHFKNYDPKVPGEAGQNNLEKYARNGGGLVLTHFACGAFQEWPDFVKIAGRVWNPQMRAHDPHGKFRVEIVEADHPITKGLAGFETTDELYTCLDGQTPIKVLAQAQSKVDQKQYPMAFVLEYGKGRVFQTVLGHDVAAFSTPGVGELLRRATAWAAGL